MTSRSKDIIFLLGAGASADAGIPVSAAMIKHVEKSFKDVTERNLYYHVKSAIYFSAGLKGQFADSVQFNIETLVNTLYELERNEEHPLYPFIAAWNSRFVALAGADFERVRQFRQRILAELKKWMCPEDSAKADYYRGLIALQRDLNYPLHVFSLNYDLCVENLQSGDFRVETGFGGYGPRYPWDWERFVDMEASNNTAAHLVLYKLHGSVNWKRQPETKELSCVQQIESVPAEELEIIFGREFKLEAADPYLFYAYKFRDLSFEAKLVIALGYGFGDSHINKMLTQSLRADADRRLLVIQRCQANECEEKVQQVGKALDLPSEKLGQLIVHPGSAKEFLESVRLSDRLISLIPSAENTPF